jgi:hypothetical protein
MFFTAFSQTFLSRLPSILKNVKPILTSFKDGQNHILFFLGQSLAQAHGLEEDAWRVQTVGAALEKKPEGAIDQDNESDDLEQILWRIFQSHKQEENADGQGLESRKVHSWHDGFCQFLGALALQHCSTQLVEYLLVMGQQLHDNWWNMREVGVGNRRELW